MVRPSLSLSLPLPRSRLQLKLRLCLVIIPSRFLPVSLSTLACQASLRHRFCSVPSSSNSSPPMFSTLQDNNRYTLSSQLIRSRLIRHNNLRSCSDRGRHLIRPLSNRDMLLRSLRASDRHPSLGRSCRIRIASQVKVNQ